MTMRLKLLPRSTLKGAIVPRSTLQGKIGVHLPSSIDADSPITVEGEGNNLTIGLDIDALVDLLPPGSGTGDVVGPAGATDEAIARFDLATGKLLQDSGLFLDDSGNLYKDDTLVITTTTGDINLSAFDDITLTAADELRLNGVTALQNGIEFLFTNPGMDVLYGWDVTNARQQNMLLADILTEASPASGDFLLIYGAEGDLRKVDWASLPAGGSGDAITVNGVAVTDADFDDATPAAPANTINVKWQKDASSPTNISAYVPQLTSAQVLALVTDETGTGALVFANTPTLVTPILGTPTSGTLTNCTGYPATALSGTVPVANGGTGQTTEAEAVGELIQALTQDATPDPANDFVGTYDASADTGKKVTLNDLITATEAQIESVIDTLANLTSIQGRTITLADAGTNAFFGWDDTAGAYENLTAAEAEAIIEPLIDTLANLTSVQGFTLTYSDPGADAIFGWDDSANAWEALTSAEATAVLDLFSTSTTTKGVVPGSNGASNSNFLRADGTWAIPSGGAASNSFETIAVSGQSNVVADSSTDTLTLVAGTNVTITTDASTDTITINATAGAGGYSTIQEEGSPLTTRTVLNFVGAGITAADDAGNTRTNVTLDADLNSWAGVTRDANFDAWVATPSSANLATLLTDETGSGLAVFATSPVLTTPQINDTSSDHQYIFAVSELAADRTVTLPLLTTNDTFVFAAFAQTLTNKTLTSPIITTSPTAAGATWTDLGTVTTADINGGTLDNVVIGGATAAAATVTTLVVNTSANPDANDGATLGVTGTRWSDLFLADGGVIDFGASGSRATITHTAASDSITIAADPDNATASSQIIFSVDGANEAILDSTSFTPGADGGSSLGTTALGWQNLFGNTGFVLNIEAGNWVATHTSGILTVGTGDLRVTTAGTNTASVVTVGGTQTLTNKTLTSPSLSSPTITGSPTAAGATWTDLGTVTTADINGGTLDNVVIGGATAAAATVTTLVVNTSANPDANDGATLGATGTRWSDLFLADGGVLDFGATGSRATITHTAASDSITIAADPDNATASSQIVFSVDGTNEAILNGTNFTPGANDGNALGVSGTAWADLFLASGAVIDFAAANVVLTHSTGILTVSTGDLRVTTAGTNIASVVTVGGTQTLTSKTIDLTNNTLTGSVTEFNTALESADFYTTGGTDVALADGGTGASLSDPGFDRLLGWDEAGNAVKFLALADIATEGSPATGDFVLAYDGSTDALVKINWSSLPGASGGIPTIGSSTDDAAVRWNGTGGGTVQDSALIIADSGAFTANANADAEIVWTLVNSNTGSSSQAQLLLQSGDGTQGAIALEARHDQEEAVIAVTGDFTISSRQARFRSEDSVTNTPVSPLQLRAETDLTPAAGMGCTLEFRTETASGNHEIGTILESVTTDVTSTSEDFDFVIKLMEAGAAATERLRVSAWPSWVDPSGARHYMPRTISLSANATVNAGTTGAEITGLSTTLVAGRYTFQYNIIYQSAATTTGVRFGINYTGTATAIVANMQMLTSATAASDGTHDQTTTGAAEGIVFGYATRAESTTTPDMGASENVDTANANMQALIFGTITVSDGGDLELWHSSEVAANSQVMAGSTLLLVRTA